MESWKKQLLRSNAAASTQAETFNELSNRESKHFVNYY